jgi:hypothetical protein
MSLGAAFFGMAFFLLFSHDHEQGVSLYRSEVGQNNSEAFEQKGLPYK